MPEYDLLKLGTVSYVNDAPQETETENGTAKLDLIEWKNNSIKGKVTAESENFVNHTQMMYLGWNAYVDGVKVKNYLVNDAMQDAYVSAGEHIIEFKFEPISFYLGAGVSIMIWRLLQERKKSRIIRSGKDTGK